MSDASIADAPPTHAVAGETGQASGSDDGRYGGLSAAERTDGVVQLTGLVAALQAELATLVVACDVAQ